MAERTHLFPELDGVRAFAVTGTLLVHSSIGWFPCAGIGVDVFFVLSGFLITDILLRERLSSGRISIRSFYRRRAFRLLPALFLLLITVDAGSMIFSGGYLRNANLRTSGRVLTYSVNWTEKYTGSFAHLWTLSVEEQFYVVWPIVLILIFRGFKGRVQTAVVSAAMACVVVLDLAYMALVAHFHTFDLWRIIAGTDTNIFGLMIGSAVAFALTRSDGRRRRPSPVLTRRLAPLCAAAILCVGLSRGTRLFLLEFGNAIVVLASAGLVVAIVSGDCGRTGLFLRGPVLTYVGRISYSLYLWHFPIYVVLDGSPWWAHHSPLEWLAKAVLPVAAAAASYHLVERPALRYQARRFPSRRVRRPSVVALASP